MCEALLVAHVEAHKPTNIQITIKDIMNDGALSQHLNMMMKPNDEGRVCNIIEL